MILDEPHVPVVAVFEHVCQYVVGHRTDRLDVELVLAHVFADFYAIVWIVCAHLGGVDVVIIPCVFLSLVLLMRMRRPLFLF